MLTNPKNKTERTMNKQNLLNLYGLKWNPFEMSIPLEGLAHVKKIDSFCWRVETLVMDGGFAMITGMPGTGKSVTLRILADRLSKIPEVQVGILTRPQSGIADFYRELGEHFGVELRSSNRWGGFKGLRERWKHHIQSTLFRPVLLIDEAQEALPFVLNELRHLASIDFDSKLILTTVLCGDHRLQGKFKLPDLIALGSRIHVRHQTGIISKEELVDVLKSVTDKSGNKHLMTKELTELLAEHAMGNLRAMMNMASNILMEGMANDAPKLDEKLFFELYTPSK